MSARLKRLKVHTFRDLAPGTELHFSDGWNVVLGRNATGKTTLLHLISMALRGDFSELKGEPVSLEYEIDLDGWEVFVALKSAPLPNGHETHRGPRSHESAQVPITSSLVARRGSTTLALGNPHPAFPELKAAQFLSLLAPGASPSLLLHFATLSLLFSQERKRPYFEECTYRFDEALELFQQIQGYPPSGPSLPRTKLSVLEDADLEWSGFLPRSADIKFDPTRDVSLRMDFDRCTHLQQALPLLEEHQLTAVSPVASVEHEEDGRLTSFDKLTILLHRADGSATSVQRLSFGQRRLFAFAWYLDSNPGAVVADELVNGMHYEWIEWCVEALKGRQVFVTAQNPLLLDHLTFHEVDDVRRGFVLCRAAREGDTRVVRWTHPSEAQSAEFLRAYENGVLRVHEILRTEGLW